MARRRKKKSSGWDDLRTWVGVLLRPHVIGLLLVAMSLFTMLSLLTGSRGSITGAWIDLLQDLTGAGLWGVPLLTGVLGLWMVIRAVEKMPDLPWQRPAGMLLIFVGWITGATLWHPTGSIRTALATSGKAGGWIGLLLADLLEAALSSWGAWSAVTVCIVLGVILLTDRLLLDLTLDSWEALQEIWYGWQARRREPTINLQPNLPLPSGELPWWRRLRDRVSLGWRPRLPTLRREPEPDALSSGQTMPGPARSSTRTPGPVQGPARVQATPPRSDTALTPHIVGGMQKWQLPRLEDMLDSWDRFVDSDELIRQRGRLIEETLALFGVPADFEGVNAGPTVTQYLIRPGYVERTVRGETKRLKVKVSKIAALANDLALALAASNVRIEAPIPGTNYVGIEVPNSESNIVGLKELMESDVYQTMRSKAKLPIALGEDVKGKPVVTDLARMPHLLIAGATGTGKSVCINSIVCSLLLTHTPETLRFLMIDPKMVELSTYNGVPHLLSPVVTDVEKAAGVLFWAVKEMERRYQLLNQANARNLERYNATLRKNNQAPLPYIVIIVDEMADLMLAAPEEVEKHICRLAQMARAVGIHLIVATQRPSVDVITGLIKANFPARIAFAVTSQTDSRVILDVPGAERLLGRGDMLFMAPDASKLERLQGSFLSEEEIGRIVRYWKGIRSLENGGTSQTGGGVAQPGPEASALGTPSATTPATPDLDDTDPFLVRAQENQGSYVQPLFEQIEQMKAVDARDALFDEAVRVVREAGRGSTTLLQRKLRIGYSRASRLVEQLEEAGILGPDQGGNQGRVVYLDQKKTAPPPGEPETPDAQASDAPLRPRIIGSEDEQDDAQPPRVWM